MLHVCPAGPDAKECPCKMMPWMLSLWSAALYGDLKLVQSHLEVRGVPPDKPDAYNYTALHYAAQKVRLRPPLYHHHHHHCRSTPAQPQPTG